MLPAKPVIPPFTTVVQSAMRSVSLAPGDAIAPAVSARVLAVRNGPTAGWVSFTYADDSTEDDVYLAAGEDWPVKLVKAVRAPSDPGDTTPATPQLYLFLG